MNDIFNQQLYKEALMKEKEFSHYLVTLLCVVAYFFAMAAFTHFTLQSAAAAPAVTTIQYMPRHLNDVPRITSEALNSRLRNGESILIVDSRATSQYDNRHISGAVSIPLDQVESRLNELPQDTEIVFYCT
jgi:hypothetical protein